MYRLVFADEVLEELGQIESLQERRKVLAALQCLTANPEGTGVGEAIDAQGRVNRIAVLGALAFVYWADHTLRTMRVLAVQQIKE
jgi:hypothetical protein